VIVVLLPGTGPVELRVTTCRSGQPFLLLHGGAGPHPVTGSGELLATAYHVCVLVPVHPRFGRTHRPDGLAGIPALAELHNGLIELLGLQDVTVTGNSIGGWTTAEIALPRSPRVSGSVLITAAIPDPPPGPCTAARQAQRTSYESRKAGGSRGPFPSGDHPDAPPSGTGRCRCRSSDVTP
jgi:pimeloyl-ACP methyl ester carboxylesterase